MDDSFYGPNQQRECDNSTPMTRDGNNFGPSFETMQNQFNGISLFSSPSFIWNPSPATTKRNPAMTSTSTNIRRPMNKTIASILSPRFGQQGDRNVLITNIPQNYYDFICEIIKAHYQHSVHDTFSKHCLGTVTMVVLFYGIDKARLCYEQLTHLSEHTKEFNLVAVSFCSSATVSSTFDIELERLQETHLAVSLFGALSNLDAINYQVMLESFGELHHLAKLEHSQVKLALLVEYKDTRHAVKAQNALHNRNEQGIVFIAHLTKLEVEQKTARITQRPLGQLRSSFENQTSLQDLSSSMRTRGPPLASRYSVFSGNDSQQWISSPSPPCARFLRPLSPSLLEPPLQLLPPPPPPPPPPHVNQQQQRASSLVPPRPFARQPRNINAPQMDSFAFNSAMDPRYHRLQDPTIPDFGMPLPIAMIHHNIKNISDHQNNDNVDLNQRLSLTIPPYTNYQDLALKNTGLHTPTGYSSGSDTAIEQEASFYFGPPTPSSLPTVERPTSTSSSQSVSNDANITNEAANTRRHRLDVDAVAENENLDFDVDNVIKDLDKRTTFMIRNIPNKYTQAMLMKCIDATHKKTYDFLYLRIDFKNKCNVGYAFINFIDCKSVIPFAKRMVGKQWNHFNSEKTCELTYARIQGKANLIEKFRNSNVMEKEASYRPIIFYSSGPRKGEKEEFPSPTTSSVSKYRLR